MRLKLLLSRCVVIAAFSSCSLSANDVLVTTTPVVIKDVAYDRAFPGKVSERKPVRVTALVDGILRQLVDEGDYVAQGDVVGRVEVLVPVYLRDKIKMGDDVALTVNAVNGKGKVQSVFSDNPDDYGMLKVMVELTDIP